MFVLIMFFVALWLGANYSRCRNIYKEAKRNSSTTRHDIMATWGYGLNFIMAVAMIVYSVMSNIYHDFSLWKNDSFLVDVMIFIICVAGWTAFCILPLLLYIFTGIVHFWMRRPYKRNELSSQEKRIYKSSGIIFYIVTALLIWVSVFLIKIFTGEITFM